MPSPSKVLLFAQRFPPSVGGTPSAVRYLFSSFPKDRLAVVSLGEAGCEATEEFGVPQDRLRPPGRVLRRVDRSFVSLAPYVAWRAGRLVPRRETGAIFANYPGICFLVAGWLLARWRRVGLYVYVHDIFKGHQFTTINRAAAALFEARILRDTRKSYFVSEALRDFYAARYPWLNAEHLPHCTNPAYDAEARIRQPRLHEWKQPGEKLIVYTGQIYAPSIEPLLNLVAALPRLQDLQVKVVISSPDPPWRIEQHGLHPGLGVTVTRLESHQEVIDLQVQADVLFNPVSFTHSASAQGRTLFPLKTTEYLQLGIPMLVHGPSHAEFVRYVERRGFAEVVSENDPELLAVALRRMLTAPEPEERQRAREAELAFRDPRAATRRLLQDFGFQ